jgi:hypothetical protein
VLGSHFGDGHLGGLDVLCFSETWLADKECVSFPGYLQFSSYGRSERSGGGVAIFIRNDIPAFEYPVQNAGLEGFEAAAVVVGEKGGVIILCVYRPPDVRLTIFLNQLETLLSACSSRFRSIIVGGDFNVDLSDRSRRDSVLLLNFMNSFGMEDTVTSPTRETNSTSTIIDNFFINFDKSLCKVENLNFELSDHYAQVMYVSPPVSFKDKDLPKFTFRRTFSMARKNIFSNLILNIDWSDIYFTNDVDEKFNIFLSRLQSVFNVAFPFKQIRISRTVNRFRWQSPELKYLCLEKRDLEILFKNNSNNVQLKYKLNELKRKIRQKINQLKEDYANKQINSSQNKNKTIWKIVNEEIKHKSKSSIYTLESGNRVVSSPFDIAQEFNECFSSRLSGFTQCKNHYPLPAELYDGPVLHEFQDCELSDVRMMVGEMRGGMSAGVDGVPALLFKKIFPLVENVVLHLCRHSLMSGIFPTSLKLAKVIPVHKKGPKNLTNNYRPIAILPSISKVLEKIAYKDLSNHFINNNILNKSQFGFQKGLSTIDAVTEYVNKVLLNLDERKKCIGFFLDLRGAFDSVDLGKLVHKLGLYGVSGTVLSWLTSYLSHRRQFVEIAGRAGDFQNVKFSSNLLEMEKGVPQGSTLGPLLFLIYINDLPFHIRAHHICLFADDSSFLVSAADAAALRENCQKLLNELSEWFLSNNLRVNAEKSFSLNFGLSSLRCDHHSYTFAMPEGPLNSTDNTRFLGVTIDRTLNWSDHIIRVCSRLRSSQVIFARLRNFLPRRVLLTCYYAYVEPILRYGIVLWGRGSQVDRAFRAQKSILRIIVGIRPRDSCRGLFKENMILTLAGLYLLEVGIYAFKHCFSWSAGIDIHDYNTRHNGQIRLDRHRTTAFEAAPAYISKKVFNNLPEELKSIKKINLFKKKLRSWLCEREFYSVGDFFSR